MLETFQCLQNKNRSRIIETRNWDVKCLLSLFMMMLVIMTNGSKQFSRMLKSIHIIKQETSKFCTQYFLFLSKDLKKIDRRLCRYTFFFGLIAETSSFNDFLKAISVTEYNIILCNDALLRGI